MTTEHGFPPLTERDHVLGDAAAEVTLVEYGDFECPYCGEAYPTLKQVKQRLGKRLRFVFRNFPLADMHPHAEHAAEAAESVAARGGQKAFWAMHDSMFEHQRHLGDASLAKYAAKAGADGDGVLEDLRTEKYAAQVRTSFIGGVRSGVNGTPTLFINGVRWDGPRDADTLVEALELVASETARR